MHTTITHRGRFKVDYAGPPPPSTADAAAAAPAPAAANLATLPSGLDPVSIPVVDASPATFQGLTELQAILDGDTPDYDFGNMHAFLASAAAPDETWFDALNE